MIIICQCVRTQQTYQAKTYTLGMYTYSRYTRTYQRGPGVVLGQVRQEVARKKEPGQLNITTTMLMKYCTQSECIVY